MQRAAAGLARRCALLLADRGGVYGGRVLLLVGSGDNGGDALYAGARLARRGAQVSALLLTPERAHAAGPGRAASRRRSAGRRARPARSTWSLDGIVGIGGTGGLRAAADERGRSASAELRGRDGERATVRRGGRAERGRGGHRRRAAVRVRPARAVRADVTVTFGALKPALVVGPAAAAGRAGRAGRHRAAAVAARHPGAAGHRVVRRGRLVAPSWARRRRSTPGAWWGWRPARRPTRARRCSPSAARWPGRPAWSATPAAPGPRCCASTRR